jgi:hypothetical protein
VGCRPAAFDSARGGLYRFGRWNADEPASRLNSDLGADGEPSAYASDADARGYHRQNDHCAYDDRAHDDRSDDGPCHDHRADNRAGNDDDSEHDDRFNDGADHHRGNHLDQGRCDDVDLDGLRKRQPRLSARLLGLRSESAAA